MATNLIDYETSQGTKTENVIFRLTAEDKLFLIKQARKYRVSMSALFRYMMAQFKENHIRIGDEQ